MLDLRALADAEDRIADLVERTPGATVSDLEMARHARSRARKLREIAEEPADGK